MTHDTSTTEEESTPASRDANARTSHETVTLLREARLNWECDETVTAALEGEDGFEDLRLDLRDVDAQHQSTDEEQSGGSKFVIQPAAITRALVAANYDGTFDALSASDEQRIRLLLHYRDRVPLRKHHVIATEDTLAGLNALGLIQPNFAAVTALILDAAQLSMVTQQPLRVPPLCLLSKPGTGKTRYARALAQVFDTSMESINGAAIPDIGSIVGWPPVWRAAGPGHAAKSLMNSATSGPVILVDEIDKIQDYYDPHPENKLLQLIERHTARDFEDEFLRVPMNASHVIWLFTANSTGNLSKPFLDRVVTMRIPDLSREARDAVLERMLDEVARDLGIAVRLENRAALQPLRSLGLRRTRIALELAVARTVAQGRREIGLADLRTAAQRLRRRATADKEQRSTPRLRGPVGFIDPRRNRRPVAQPAGDEVSRGALG